MKKLTTLFLVLLLIGIGTGIAAAQNYYPREFFRFATELSEGSVDALGDDAVYRLQLFLRMQPIPEAAILFPTGRFEALTAQALRSFQLLHSLSPTGTLDVFTRATIRNMGESSYVYAPHFPFISPLRIDSLSPTFGGVGTQVTITGSGFEATANTVHFGDVVFTNAFTSSDGRTITFSVPSWFNPSTNPSEFRSIPVGTYQIRVSNSRGVSNQIPFVVTSGFSSVVPQTEIVSFSRPFDRARISDRPRIVAMSAPQSVALGNSATLPLTISGGAGLRTLMIQWGDGMIESQFLSGGFSETPLVLQHGYVNRGSYVFRIVVSDSRGETDEISGSVNIF